MLALGLISLLFGVGTTLAIIGGEDGSTLLQHGATTRSPSIKTMKEMQSANKHIFNLISGGEASSALNPSTANSSVSMALGGDTDPAKMEGVINLSASTENSPDSIVYFVTAMFNRGPLFDIAVESMAKLAAADPNIFWILVDYGTPGRDVKTHLKEIGIKHEYILKENERFSRTLGLQYALEEVPGDDSLVMALDLVAVPTDFAHHVRRNIRKGQTVYAPVMFKLYPGQPTTSRDGEDYAWSWGLLGFVKKDCTQFGGLVGANKGKIDMYKWGCEDVFLADKFGEYGFVAVRGVIKDLIHYTLTDYEKSNLSTQLPESQRWKEYNSGRNNECMVNNNDEGKQKNVRIDEYEGLSSQQSK
jgi:hypothetical protein